MKTFRIWHKKEQEHVQKCQHDGCVEEGEYRAPKSCDDANQTWLWFCLKHVRHYNERWNYFSGMSEEDVLKQWFKDITWERPSWPLGNWFTKSHYVKTRKSEFSDPFGIFSNSYKAYQDVKKEFVVGGDKWLDLFELPANFTEDQLQQSYRKLVKQYHPDVNQDDSKANEKIRLINDGYAQLKKRLGA